MNIPAKKVDFLLIVLYLLWFNIFFVIFIWHTYLPIKQIAANKKYNPEAFKTFFRFGVIKTNINAQNQLKEKEIDAQSLVDSGGWISALKVHASGPNPVIKIIHKLLIHIHM